MAKLMQKLILEEPADEVVKTTLTEDSLVKDEPVVKDAEIEVSEPVIADKSAEVVDKATPEKPQTTPETNNDFGVAGIINSAIIDEFGAIDLYNSIVATVKDLVSREQDSSVISAYESIINIVTDIVNEENIHVGQLQKALSLVSPNASLIKDGETKAESHDEVAL